MANVLQPYYLLQSAFTGGEISSEVSNRVDLDKYQYSVLRAKNCLVRPYGPIYKRPGLKYIARTRYSDKKSILVAFNGSDDKDCLLNIGEKYIEVFKNGEKLNVEIVTPYLESDLAHLRFTQSADTMFIASGKYPVKQLARYSDNDWRFGDFEITNMYFDETLAPTVVRGQSYGTPGSFSFTPDKTGAYTVTISGAGGGAGGYARSGHGRFGIKTYGGIGGRGEMVVKKMMLNSGSTYNGKVGKGGAHGSITDYDTASNGLDGEASTFENITMKGGGGGTGVRKVRYTDGKGNKRYTFFSGEPGTSQGNGALGGANKTVENEYAAFDGSNGYVNIIYDENNTITPSAVNGEVTLTAKNNTFSKSSVGSSIMLKHEVAAQEVAVSNGTSSHVKIGETWKVISHGTWTGTFEVQKSVDGESWETYRKYSSKNDYNPSESGSVSKEVYLRIVCNVTSGTCNVNLTAMPYTKEGIAKITEFVSEKQVNALVTEDFGSTKATDDYLFGAWSEDFGYPQTVCFFQDRLCFGGTKKQPYMVWMSRTGDYGNFSVEKASGTVTDDSAVAVAFVSRKQFKILHMVAGTDLMILTAGNEWTISGNETVTPTKCVPKMQTTRGCNNCEPLMIGGRVVFVQGRGSTVRDMGYSFETDSYGGTDLTLLAKHLIEGVDIVDSDYKQEPDSTIYFVRSDGTMLCLAYILEQKVYAWSQLATKGRIESVASIQEGDEDIMYIVVERTINGKNVRNIEFFYSNSSNSNNPDDYVMLDAAVVLENTKKEATEEYILVPELAGETVDVVGDGRVYKNIVIDKEGGFTLPNPVKHAVVGLPYESVIELPNVEIRTGDGTMQGRFKQVSSCIVRLKNSLGGTAGCSTDTMDQLQYDELSAVKDIRLFSGDKKITLPIGGFNNDGRIVIQSDEPYPLNVLAIVREVTFGG